MAQLSRRPGHTFVFFSNSTATTEIYTLSLHDALPISPRPRARRRGSSHRGRGGREESPSLSVGWLRARSRSRLEHHVEEEEQEGGDRRQVEPETGPRAEHRPELRIRLVAALTDKRAGAGAGSVVHLPGAPAQLRVREPEDDGRHDPGIPDRIAVGFECKQDPKDQHAPRADSDENIAEARDTRKAGDVTRRIPLPQPSDQEAEEHFGGHKDERQEDVQEQQPVVERHRSPNLHDPEEG